MMESICLSEKSGCLRTTHCYNTEHCSHPPWDPHVQQSAWYCMRSVNSWRILRSLEWSSLCQPAYKGRYCTRMQFASDMSSMCLLLALTNWTKTRWTSRWWYVKLYQACYFHGLTAWKSDIRVFVLPNACYYVFVIHFSVPVVLRRTDGQSKESYRLSE
jgi:hypothetical protein